MQKYVACVVALVCGCSAAEGDAEGYSLVGDVMVKRGGRGRTLGASGGTERETLASALWPDPRAIPYVIDPWLAKPERVVSAIEEYHERTCLRFVERTSEADYIVFKTGTQCSSFVGRQGGAQVVLLGNACGIGETIHEIGHALSLVHEHARRDRDRFVYVNHSNISPATADNFLIESVADVGPYDYASVMHYPAHAFTVSTEPTIVAPSYIGQRQGLSMGDVATLEFMYTACNPNPTLRCMSSYGDSPAVVVPHSRTFTATIVGIQRGTLTANVSVTGPQPVSPPAGATGASPLAVNITFTPEVVDIGGEYTFTTVFHAVDGSTASCRLIVQVSSSDKVCFGRAEPEACSGDRGVCQAEGYCKCAAGYGGAECDAFARCSRDGVLGFDDQTAGGEYRVFTGGPVTDPYYKGGSALMVQDQMHVYTKTFAPASGRIGFSIYPKRGQAPAEVVGVVAADQQNEFCWSVYIMCAAAGRLSCQWRVNGEDFEGVEVVTERWYRVEVLLKGDSMMEGEMQVWVDGRCVYDGPQAAPCLDGTSLLVFAAVPTTLPEDSVIVDEVEILCTRHAKLFGTIGRATQHDVVLGGLTIEIEAVGDVWNTSNPLEILNAFKAKRPATLTDSTGWVANYNQLLFPLNVTFPTPSSAVITLNPAPSYASQLDEVVELRLPGRFPSASAPFFTIPGTCPQDLRVHGMMSLDDAPDGVSVALGRGNRSFAPESLSFAAFVPADASVTVFFLDAAGADVLSLHYRDKGSPAFCVKGPFDLCDFTLPSQTTIRTKVSFERDPGKLTIELPGHGEMTSLSVPAFTTIRAVAFRTGSANETEAEFGNVTMLCPFVPPSALVARHAWSVGELITVRIVDGGTSYLSPADALFFTPVGTPCKSAPPGPHGRKSPAGALTFNAGELSWAYEALEPGDFTLCYLGARRVWLPAKGAEVLVGGSPVPATVPPISDAPSPTAEPTEEPTEEPAGGKGDVTTRVVVALVVGNTALSTVSAAAGSLVAELKEVLDSPTGRCKEICIYRRRIVGFELSTCGGCDVPAASSDEADDLRQESAAERYLVRFDQLTTTMSTYRASAAVIAKGEDLAAVTFGSFVDAVISQEPVPPVKVEDSDPKKWLWVAIGFAVLLVLVGGLAAWVFKRQRDRAEEMDRLAANDLHNQRVDNNESGPEHFADNEKPNCPYS
ncbi:Astacin-like metalloprotease toxin 1 [Diplonema papillatum]|nr:Astacin-like metalloprotease toxin 1 [Diplonema papillatum]